MTQPVENRYVNRTPYPISYKKSKKILPNTPFLVDESVDVREIEVWYGRNWVHRSQIFLDGTDIFYRAESPNSPRVVGSGDVMQLLETSIKN